MSRPRRMPPVGRRFGARAGRVPACSRPARRWAPTTSRPTVHGAGAAGSRRRRWPSAAAAPLAARRRSRAAAGRRRSRRELVDTAWWTAFGDPQLDALIRVALDENKDLRIAAYRVEQYNAQLQVAQVGGQAAGQRRTRSAAATRSARTASIPLVAGTYPVGNIYEIGGAVTWELDFWGRVRRANESALADLLASEEDRRALVLTLVSNVASTYVTLLGARSRARAASARGSRAATSRCELLAKKIEGGGVGEQPYLKAKAEYEEALAELTVKETEIAVLEHALCVAARPQPGSDRARQAARGADPAADSRRAAGRPAGAAARRAQGRAGAGLGQRPDRRRQGAVPADASA